eukprot:CAMPEP_0196574268 /NCGR_PEP_ID=MMETSP1081-20130531/4017_1 /TAXON_ID=36882 /ORGANISM="Pyramimonas amylifera, Strain CCMP720" /LENGTH=276 /DNA_ID=CAMNT_0041892235 /DNA_START=263 /DNA_END=1093 /DNA_ORIENTATION=+
MDLTIKKGYFYRNVASLRNRIVVNAQKDSGDFVTNLIGKIFPSALEDMQPAGLQRMTVEEWPDQWPAVTDQWAEPLDTDDDELSMLRPLLKQTMLESVPLGLVYDANVHGWSPLNFHKQVDGMGAAVLVAQTTGGSIFGGYNPKGWLGYGDWRDAISAFLFTWPDGELDAFPLKLPKTGGSGMAIIDEPGGGPQWGPDGLKVDLGSRSATSRLGPYYERRSDGKKTLFSSQEGANAELLELRVYVGLEETEKAKNYTPNMIQFQKGELQKIRGNDK